MKDPNATAAAHVLICGASFAGLSTAFWMIRLGYTVTVVEIAQGLRKGGTPIDIRDRTVQIVHRMGLLDAVRRHSLPPRRTEFKTADDQTEAWLPPQSGTEEGYEIERDALLEILFRQIADRAEVLFDTSVSAVDDRGDSVGVTLTDGSTRDFALVFGCDGNHSTVRRLCFGDEAKFSHFLGQYIAISIVKHHFIAPNTTQIFSVPGKSVMLNSYEDKTDIVFIFHAPDEIPYDRRDLAQQRQLVAARFDGLGWRTPDLLAAWSEADNFYFDKLCQIRMPQWTKGRVALVGDAAYCVSPAAGMGGSLALVGAGALADALGRHPQDVAAAFADYDADLRPYITEVQNDAVSFGLAMFCPTTAEALVARNQQLAAMAAA